MPFPWSNLPSRTFTTNPDSTFEGFLRVSRLSGVMWHQARFGYRFRRMCRERFVLLRNDVSVKAVLQMQRDYSPRSEGA